MKKIIILMLVVLLLPMNIHSAYAADTETASVAIPTTTGLTGSNNSAKSFFSDLPSGINASAITISSLKYSGNNEMVGSVTIENGKLKVTLKGIVNSKTVQVTGYKQEFENNFITNIGNSIWLYSDGRRWQINEYKESINSLDSFDDNATDSSTPSADPPKRVVSAASNQSTAGLIWYASATETVDSHNVITSTIQLEPARGSSYLKGKPKYKNDKIITSYYIGPEEAGVNSDWEDHTSKATIPVTGWVQGRFYSAFATYYYKATAKLTTYSYGGTVTFDYTPPTEPTLTGSATILKPNPNPTKFANSDVPVQLSLKGDLAAYTDTSNISEWVFYAKKKGDNSTLQTKKDYGKILTSKKEFSFTIPKEKIISDNVEVSYDLTVVVRFTKPVMTSSGSITSLEKSFTSTVEVYKKESSIVIPPGPPVTIIEGKPPVAILDIPNEVMAGEEFLISGGGSYDPDGTIVDYIWGTPNVVNPISGKNGFTWYTTNSIGTQNVSLRVIDNDDMSSATAGKIRVVQPIPMAALEIRGTKKENRKVTIHNKSVSPKHYPIDPSKTQMTIVPVSGGTAADIKYSGSLNGTTDKDVLFKKAGTYNVTISVTNTAGFSDTTSTAVVIAPDKPPVVYFSIPSKVYRSPQDGNQAIVSLSDMSFSPDYDFISRRLWEYRYDSNNNDSFTDESWTIYSNENKSVLNLALNEVGKYEVRLTVFEEFDQPTIDEFVTQADRRFADSYSSLPPQPLIERIVEVDNRRPEVDWSW